jgi:hypothetical protein
MGSEIRTCGRSSSNWLSPAPGQRVVPADTTPHGAVFGLAHNGGRRASANVRACTEEGAGHRHTAQSHYRTPRGAVQTHLGLWEARTGSASRHHTSWSHSNSPTAIGGARRQCQSPPHLVEPFELAYDDWRCALIVPVTATPRGPFGLTRDDGRRVLAVPVAATSHEATWTSP